MKVLIVNAVLYTSESKNVKKIDTIKDCMIYNLCLAFKKAGHDVTLAASDQYKPKKQEKYPFQIIWMKTSLKRIFPANKMPCNFGVLKLLKKNQYDLIISSESFQLNSLFCVLKERKKTIIWQEMAFHQKMAKQLASKFWHNVIFRLFFHGVIIVPRSTQAHSFISRYSKNVSDTIVEHGVDLEKFKFCDKKGNSFIVSSQLIERKHIDQIIVQFNNYLLKYKLNQTLYIAGDGALKNDLERLVKKLNISKNVIFLGKVSHSKLIEYLSQAVSMLVYTSKDNSMLSITESISVGTPVITTSVPNNAYEINKYKLGIVKDKWDCDTLYKIYKDNSQYVNNCKQYRKSIDNIENVKKFIAINEARS